MSSFEKDLDCLVGHLTRPQVSRISSRRKRSLRFLINNTDDHQQPTPSLDTRHQVQVKLMSFDQTFILHLSPIKTSDFLSPSIQFIDKSNMYDASGQQTTGAASSSATTLKSDCFYTGHVNNDIKSLAYINLCHEGHIVS